ncbi:MAG: 2-oxoacid:acceptor oxidoreductase family protein [Dehalococcoidia bacterium]
MPQDLSKVELIIAGVGGQGVLFAGQMMAVAGMRKYKYVTYMPSYGTEKRGGPSECTVVLSDEPIASPVLDQAQTVMLLDSSQAQAFEGRVRPQGTMIVEKTGLEYDSAQSPFTLTPISGLEIAMSMGDSMVNNLIMLGAYIEITGALPADLVLEEIERKSGDRDALLQRNREAFSRGLDLGKSIAV